MERGSARGLTDGPRARATTVFRAVIALLAVPVASHAQAGAPQPDDRPSINAATDPLLRGFRWRSIGPTQQGGRVDDIAVVESDPSVFYVGFATGGIWKTTNNGVTFAPIFDTYGTHSIGDIAIAPSNSNILYVGTGEPNNRQSSSFGDGVYKSTDAGKTFTHVGLRESQSIGRVVVHPRSPDVVWVAAVGHLFGPNTERGVFKSTDGGRSWTRTLFVDENTGATDIVIHPTNPDVLFAATYVRRRTSWAFASGGAGSGIWKSTDGGGTWSRLTGNGLPRGTMGRIGLDIARSNPEVVYAQIEVAPDREDPGARAQLASGDAPVGGQEAPPDSSVSGMWRSSDGGRTWRFMSNQNNRPSYYSKFRVDPNDENTLFVGGAGAFKSTDGGRSWHALMGFGHGDHHAFWIDPKNSKHVLDGNDGGIEVSWDGGMTWQSPRTAAVGQAYHVSVDMRRPYFVCTGQQDNGSWCGPSSLRSGPILSQDWYRVGGGDGFYTQVDPSDHNVVYAEGSNGSIIRHDLRSGTTVGIRPRESGAGRGGSGAAQPLNVVPPPDSGVRFRFNWSTPIVLSPHDPSTVYTGANRFFKSRNRGATWTMSGDLTKQIDRDQREIIGLKGSLPACGRQRQGACILSKNDGVSAYGTIVTIAESPVAPGLIWVGTDDGNVQVTRDGGDRWTEVGKSIPGGAREYYVSRVEPSHFDAGTAYVSLDGHRSDDLRPYVFVTRDYGRTWTPLAATLPAYGNVNVVKQDPRNRNVLYAGTEFGVHVSLDDGKSWKPFMTNLPVVRVDDILVHPRENDLVLATHGRGIWIMDDVTPLQQLTAATMAEQVVLFEPRNPVSFKPDIRLRRAVTGDHYWEGDTAPPGTSIAYYLKNPVSGDVTITIHALGGSETLRAMAGTKHAGLNQVRWNLCSDPRVLRPGESAGLGRGGGGNPISPIRDPSRPPDPCYSADGGDDADEPAPRGASARQGQRRVARLAPPGAYVVTLTVDGRSYSRSVTVLEDVWMAER